VSAAERRDGDRLTVVIGPPPTPNGDLHVGHLAGPYMAADVYARYARASGRQVIYTTGTDDSQTYVVATARRLGTTPEELCRRCSHDIRRTLDAMAIAVDGFAPFDDGYRSTVIEFVTALHAAGKFRRRAVSLPWSERRSEFLMEGLVAGDCPVCLAESRGGLCETCGHPNDFDELVDPRSTTDPHDVLTTREAEVLVLPMEEYRDQLTAYHEARRDRWRPHIVQLAEEVLDRPLPDFPITYPYSWGIPAPFPETPGQVLNAWVEGMPASIYCTEWAAREMGVDPAAAAQLWRAEHDIALVYFLGFDNAYFWGMTHLALLMAHEGRYVLPDTIVCNEFYELENEKFSTSRGHVVWGHDLVREVPRDLVRFYLALTAPEHQRTNFSRAALEKVVAERLVAPWDQLADLLRMAAALGGPGPLPVSPAARARAAAMVDRFRACYELSRYSLTRAADLVVVHLDRLVRRALDGTPPGDLFLETTALVAAAAPVLVDVAAELAATSGGELSLAAGAFEVDAVAPFDLPRLGTRGPARTAMAARG
jgi:methionyl-tRNA synthetase